MRLNTTNTEQLTGWRRRFLFVSLISCDVTVTCSSHGSLGCSSGCSPTPIFFTRARISGETQFRRVLQKHRVRNTERTAVRLNIQYMNPVRTSQGTLRLNHADQPGNAVQGGKRWLFCKCRYTVCAK